MREFSSGRRTVVFCHPVPGSGLLDPQPDVTVSRDVALLGVDCPGYGASDPRQVTQWASVDRAAEDLAWVLDDRGVRGAGVAGWSVGGWVALSLAAQRPDLVDRVVLVGTPAPHRVVPWIPESCQSTLDALREREPQEAHPVLDAHLQAHLLGVHQGPLLDLLGRSAADDAALRINGAEARLTRMLEVAFEQGTAGFTADVAGFVLRPWRFDPGDVRAKTLLLYGSRDPITGAKHATWWKQLLPSSRVEMVPGEGHLLLMRHWARVLSHLAPHTTRP